ncbi:MAG: hypothetical protein PHH16_04920 [Candidatus Gracilibacteria bacterium]|nr:hypothetical protein [Candidatus Gracilibacteria bacterium]
MCQITEIPSHFPIGNRKILYLGSFAHRTHHAAGVLPKISDDFGANFTYFDWPKMEFNEEKVVNEIVDYIRENPNNEIIVISLSFGEIIARKVFAKLTDSEAQRIKKYISICGVSFGDELKIPKVTYIAEKVKKQVLQVLTGKVGLGMRGRYGKWVRDITMSGMVDKSPTGLKDTGGSYDPEEKDIGILEQKGALILSRFSKATSIGMTPGTADRLQLILRQKKLDIEECNNRIPTDIIFSENDWQYINPYKNAEKLKKIHSNSNIIPVSDGKHADVTSRGAQYKKAILPALEELWGKASPLR